MASAQNAIFQNRPFTIFVKFLRNLCYILYRLKLFLEVIALGPRCKVLQGVLISGGKNISIGKGCFLGRNIVLDAAGGELRIGNNVEIRDGTRIYARKITIGDGVTIGEDSFLNGNIKITAGSWIARGCDLTGNVAVEHAILGPQVACMGGGGHVRDPKTGAVLMSDRGLNDSQAAESQQGVRILAGAWVGYGAILLGHVTVFSNGVVGAGSVVTKDVSEGTVVAGNPAKPIQSKFSL